MMKLAKKIFSNRKGTIVYIIKKVKKRFKFKKFQMNNRTKFCKTINNILKIFKVEMINSKQILNKPMTIKYKK